MLSIGMSNTFQEFGRFQARATFDPAVNSDLVIINAAQGSQPADVWDQPTDATWQNVKDQLTSAGLTAEQVQVAWMKHAVRSPMFPPLDFPDHPETLQTILEGIATSLKENFPNCVLFFVSSRTRAYNTNQAAQSPEPASYEGGFAVQWMIEKQMSGDASLRFDGVDPPAPWMSWGPYLWTDGLGAPFGTPPSPLDARSDGFVWTCADVDRDGVHPSPPTPDPNPATGEFKVGDMIAAFFLTDPVATPWFLESTSNGPTVNSLTANGQDVSLGQTITGAAPFSVSMVATTTGSTNASWTFDDRTFSYNPGGNSSGTPSFDDTLTPTKLFHVPGTYDVRFAARDASGNSTLKTFPVVVTGSATAAPSAPDRPMTLVAFPNPFNPSTTFRYTLPVATLVQLGDLRSGRPAGVRSTAGKASRRIARVRLGRNRQPRKTTRVGKLSRPDSRAEHRGGHPADPGQVITISSSV